MVFASHAGEKKKNKPKLKISSDYIKAANAIRGKKERKRIVAYVESYDDVFFWRSVLSEFETDERYFEVMLPTRSSLSKGKKQAITQMMADGAGECMIACVDADYDYLMQGATFSSKDMLSNPYIFHTVVYAIENYQCYAPSLHNVCVMATLNDHAIFDFRKFFADYSQIIYPLFLWNILLYRNLDFHTFSMTDFNRIIEMGHFTISRSEEILSHLSRKVNHKLQELRKRFPARQKDLDRLSLELSNLGVTTSSTYLYIQGHHLFDNAVLPIIETVCKTLRNEREDEIRRKAHHIVQRQNELSAYCHAQTDPEQMLRRNTAFTASAPYQRLKARLQEVFN